MRQQELYWSECATHGVAGLCLCGVRTTALTSHRVSQDRGPTEDPDKGEVMLTCTAVSTS